MKKPPKYGGFAFSETGDPKRKGALQKQLAEHGFDDSELWNLDSTIIEYLIPRMKRYKEINNGHPAQLTAKEWDEKLDSIVVGFEEYLKDEFDETRSMKKINKAFKNFVKFFQHFWI